MKSVKDKIQLVNVIIDDQKIEVENNLTIIEAAKKLNIDIPSLCYHKDLLPYGACRICMVEIEIKGRSRLVASCGYYVQDGLIVKTSSERIEKSQKILTELYYGIIPDNSTIRKLAVKYDIDRSRFKRNDSYCIHCGLCVRYCNEVKGKNAIGTVGRGKEIEIAWIPLSSYNEHCERCCDCIYICPTGVFPSNWGIAKL